MAGVARPIRLNAMFAIGLAFFTCNAVSILYGAEILGHPVIFRDFYDLPKVWMPVAFFTIAYEADLTELSLRRLIDCFSVAVMLVCLYAWGQFVGAGFAYKLNPYYSPGGHIDAALEYAKRVYGTMGNANVLGSLMTWCIVLFLLAAVFRVGSTLRNLILVLSCLITLVMTGSRYGLLSVSFAFLMILAFVSTIGRRRLAQFALLLLLLPAFVWTYETVATSNRRTLQRYETLKHPLQIDSLRQRLDDVWLEAWSDFKSSPVFGHGPGKGFLVWNDRFIDSEYLNVLREKGVVGFVVFLAYYIYPLYLIRKGRHEVRFMANQLLEQFPANMVCLHAGLIIGVLALIMDIGMATFYSPFLQGTLWLWLGIGAGCAARLGALAPARRPLYSSATLFQPQKAPFV
jgi:O-antigen ligase